MNSIIVLFGLLATLAVVQGIAIGKPAEKSSETTAVVNPNNGFVVQSGYEGYIVSPQKSVVTSNNNWLAPAKIAFLKSLLLPFASFLLVYGAKIVTVGIHLVLALLVGVAATTAVCTLTPICTITLASPAFSIFKGQSVKEQVAELARTYMTPENVEMATRFVQSALEKYSINPRREPEQPSVQDNETTSE